MQVKLIQFFQVLRSYKYLSKQNEITSLKSLSMKSLSIIFSNHIHDLIDMLVTKFDFSTSLYVGNLLGVYGKKEIMSKYILGILLNWSLRDILFMHLKNMIYG